MNINDRLSGGLMANRKLQGRQANKSFLEDKCCRPKLKWPIGLPINRRLSSLMLVLTLIAGCWLVSVDGASHLAKYRASSSAAANLRDRGCYYMLQHYKNGESIRTDEPCLNCTCENSMLMCYLRVCPYVKPIGDRCIIERVPGECCPRITCPDSTAIGGLIEQELNEQQQAQQVPSSPTELQAANLQENSTATTTQTILTTQKSSQMDDDQQTGCSIAGQHFAEGALMPADPSKPCEICYCIKGAAACVMQDCALEVTGCQPIHLAGACCPTRYNCSSSAIGGSSSSSSSQLLPPLTSPRPPPLSLGSRDPPGSSTGASKSLWSTADQTAPSSSTTMTTPSSLSSPARRRFWEAFIGAAAPAAPSGIPGDFGRSKAPPPSQMGAGGPTCRTAGQKGQQSAVVWQDGERVPSRNKCEHCYCVRGEIVCAVQECRPPCDGCRALPNEPSDAGCCPTRYECAAPAQRVPADHLEDGAPLAASPNEEPRFSSDTPTTERLVEQPASSVEPAAGSSSTTTGQPETSSSTTTILNGSSPTAAPSGETTKAAAETPSVMTTRHTLRPISPKFSPTGDDEPAAPPNQVSQSTQAPGLSGSSLLVDGFNLTNEREQESDPSGLKTTSGRFLVNEGPSSSTTSFGSTLLPALSSTPASPTAAGSDEFELDEKGGRPAMMPSIIPGEGSCRYGNRIYQNGEKVKPKDRCMEICMCINSVVYCDEVDCPKPPTNVAGCQQVQQKGECCPSWICGQPEGDKATSGVTNAPEKAQEIPQTTTTTATSSVVSTEGPSPGEMASTEMASTESPIKTSSTEEPLTPSTPDGPFERPAATDGVGMQIGDSTETTSTRKPVEEKTSELATGEPNSMTRQNELENANEREQQPTTTTTTAQPPTTTTTSSQAIPTTEMTSISADQSQLADKTTPAATGEPATSQPDQMLNSGQTDLSSQGQPEQSSSPSPSDLGPKMADPSANEPTTTTTAPSEQPKLADSEIPREQPAAPENGVVSPTTNGFPQVFSNTETVAQPNEQPTTTIRPEISSTSSSPDQPLAPETTTKQSFSSSSSEDPAISRESGSSESTATSNLGDEHGTSVTPSKSQEQPKVTDTPRVEPSIDGLPQQEFSTTLQPQMVPGEGEVSSTLAPVKPEAPVEVMTTTMQPITSQPEVSSSIGSQPKEEFVTITTTTTTTTTTGQPDKKVDSTVTTTLLPQQPTIDTTTTTTISSVPSSSSEQMQPVVDVVTAKSEPEIGVTSTTIDDSSRVSVTELTLSSTTSLPDVMIERQDTTIAPTSMSPELSSEVVTERPDATLAPSSASPGVSSTTSTDVFSDKMSNQPDTTQSASSTTSVPPEVSPEAITERSDAIPTPSSTSPEAVDMRSDSSSPGQPITDTTASIPTTTSSPSITTFSPDITSVASVDSSTGSSSEAAPLPDQPTTSVTSSTSTSTESKEQSPKTMTIPSETNKAGNQPDGSSTTTSPSSDAGSSSSPEQPQVVTTTMTTTESPSSSSSSSSIEPQTNQPTTVATNEPTTLLPVNVPSDLNESRMNAEPATSTSTVDITTSSGTTASTEVSTNTANQTEENVSIAPVSTQAETNVDTLMTTSIPIVADVNSSSEQPLQPTSSVAPISSSSEQTITSTVDSSSLSPSEQPTTSSSKGLNNEPKIESNVDSTSASPTTYSSPTEGAGGLFSSTEAPAAPSTTVDQQDASTSNVAPQNEMGSSTVEPKVESEQPSTSSSSENPSVAITTTTTEPSSTTVERIETTVTPNLGLKTDEPTSSSTPTETNPGNTNVPADTITTTTSSIPETTLQPKVDLTEPPATTMKISTAEPELSVSTSAAEMTPEAPITTTTTKLAPAPTEIQTEPSTSKDAAPEANQPEVDGTRGSSEATSEAPTTTGVPATSEVAKSESESETSGSDSTTTAIPTIESTTSSATGVSFEVGSVSSIPSDSMVISREPESAQTSTTIPPTISLADLSAKTAADLNSPSSSSVAISSEPSVTSQPETTTVAIPISSSTEATQPSIEPTSTSIINDRPNNIGGIDEAAYSTVIPARNEASGAPTDSTTSQPTTQQPPATTTTTTTVSEGPTEVSSSPSSEQPSSSSEGTPETLSTETKMEASSQSSLDSGSTTATPMAPVETIQTTTITPQISSSTPESVTPSEAPTTVIPDRAKEVDTTVSAPTSSDSSNSETIIITSKPDLKTETSDSTTRPEITTISLGSPTNAPQAPVEVMTTTMQPITSQPEVSSSIGSQPKEEFVTITTTTTTTTTTGQPDKKVDSTVTTTLLPQQPTIDTTTTTTISSVPSSSSEQMQPVVDVVTAKSEPEIGVTSTTIDDSSRVSVTELTLSSTTSLPDVMIERQDTTIAPTSMSPELSSEVVTERPDATLAPSSASPGVSSTTSTDVFSDKMSNQPDTTQSASSTTSVPPEVSPEAITERSDAIPTPSSTSPEAVDMRSDSSSPGQPITDTTASIPTTTSSPSITTFSPDITSVASVDSSTGSSSEAAPLPDQPTTSVTSSTSTSTESKEQSPKTMTIPSETNKAGNQPDGSSTTTSPSSDAGSSSSPEQPQVVTTTMTTTESPSSSSSSSSIEPQTNQPTTVATNEPTTLLPVNVPSDLNESRMNADQLAPSPNETSGQPPLNSSTSSSVDVVSSTVGSPVVEMTSQPVDATTTSTSSPTTLTSSEEMKPVLGGVSVEPGLSQPASSDSIITSDPSTESPMTTTTTTTSPSDASRAPNSSDNMSTSTLAPIELPANMTASPADQFVDNQRAGNNTGDFKPVEVMTTIGSIRGQPASVTIPWSDVISSTAEPMTTTTNAEEFSSSPKPTTTTTTTTAPTTTTTTTTTSAPITTTLSSWFNVTTTSPAEPSSASNDYEDAAEEAGCEYEGKVYSSAQQVPRQHPCDFCFCFRGDIICLQQTCPPPVPHCFETVMDGFCCPRYECPVHTVRTSGLNSSNGASNSTNLALTPYESHSRLHAHNHEHQLQNGNGNSRQQLRNRQQPAAGSVRGCFVDNRLYRVGQVIESASGPCMECKCERTGMMKCNPKECSPDDPLLQQINREVIQSTLTRATGNP